MNTKLEYEETLGEASQHIRKAFQISERHIRHLFQISE